MAAQPPQASPVSQAHATYTHGQDAGDLAARARELGLERRAALLEASRQRHSLYGGTLKSTRLRLAVLASFDPDLEEEDWQRTPSTPTARRPLDRSPSWLEDVEARREARQSGFTLQQAFLATVKSAVGPAVLYMPRGFEEGGLAFSLGMLVLSFALFGLGATRLLEAWALHGRSYSGLMGKAFGLKGVYLCRVTIVLQQCGICLTYVIFIATNCRELWAYWTGATPTLATCCALQLLVLVPLSWIRDMQTFATTNLIANALILYALIVLALHATTTIAHDPPASLSTLPLFNRESFYLFVGTSAFVYEGSAALVVPLQEAAASRTGAPTWRSTRRFSTNPPKMYGPVRTCAGIIATYICFGALNWIAYGKSTQVVLTLNLPRGPWKASVQLAYSLAVVFTFPLQLYPAVQILKSVGRKLKRLSVSRVGYVAIDDRRRLSPWSSRRRRRTPRPTRRRARSSRRGRARPSSRATPRGPRSSRCSSPWPWPRSGASTRSSRSSAASSASRSPSSTCSPCTSASCRTRRRGRRALSVVAMGVGAVLGFACSAVTVLTWNRSYCDVGLTFANLLFGLRLKCCLFRASF